MIRFWIPGLLFLMSVMVARTQPVHEDLPRITSCIALTNARVITQAGLAPSVQHVIIRNGLITDAGPKAIIPPDAYRIAADSLYVYPAFIDAFSHTGIKAPEEQNRQGGSREREPVDEHGNPSLEAAGITPFLDIRGGFQPGDKSVSDWRAQGFAVAHVVPRGRMIPGKGSVVVLSGNSADESIWRENISLYGQWSGASSGYPGTVIGIMAKWRELYHNAEQYVVHQNAYESASLVSRPHYNRAHESLVPLVQKQIPLFFRALKVKDISRAMALQHELGMTMVLADAEEAWYLSDQIKQRKTAVVLSLDLPEDTDKKEDDKLAEKGGAEKTEGKKEEEKSDPEKEAFEKRRVESLRQHRAQAAELIRAGIPVSFGTLSAKPGDFSKTMQTLIENGLDTAAALAALTTTPASLLGIDAYCGTVTKGKMANLIVTSQPLFQKETRIRYMIVEGNLFAYQEKEKKKRSGSGDSTDVASLEGTWSYIIDIPGDPKEGTFTLRNEAGTFVGKISSKDITSGQQDLDNVVVEGKQVSFSFDFELNGQILHIEYDLEFDGEEFEGSVTVGEFGTFPVTGELVTKPE